MGLPPVHRSIARDCRHVILAGWKTANRIGSALRSADLRSLLGFCPYSSTSPHRWEDQHGRVSVGAPVWRCTVPPSSVGRSVNVMTTPAMSAVVSSIGVSATSRPSNVTELSVQPCRGVPLILMNIVRRVCRWTRTSLYRQPRRVQCCGCCGVMRPRPRWEGRRSIRRRLSRPALELDAAADADAVFQADVHVTEVRPSHSNR